MRKLLIVFWVLLCSITSAGAQVSFGIAGPGVEIGINFPVYPQLVQVSGYPVYYAPQVNSNYFFYDGMYWVYQQDNWYASSWYNGPWGLVAPEAVPLFILRVPVRYYRRPPAYFRGWGASAPPRWGDHWGNTWAQSRQGWDNWNRSSVPAPAPLPLYQRQYSGNKYPRAEQQQVIQSQNYRYQPRDAVVQQHFQTQQVQSAPAVAPKVTQGVPQETGARQQQGAAQQKAQQQQGAAQQKAQQQQAETQQKAQQQQQQQGAAQQKAQQQQAETQQKVQQQQERQGAAQQKAQQQQQQGAAQQKAQQQADTQQRAQQQQAASQQKAQQQQQQQAAGQQKAQQQQQQQAAAQQKAQQQQQAAGQQKAQQQQQQQAAAQQKAQQQQQQQAAGQQKAQQQQQQQAAAQQRAQQPPQAAATREQKATKQAPEKPDQQGAEHAK